MCYIYDKSIAEKHKACIVAQYLRKQWSLDLGLAMRMYMYIVQYLLLTNQHSVMALPGLVENFKPKMISSPSLVLLAHSLFTMILFYRGDGVKGLHGNPGGSSPHSDDSDCSINKDSSLITPKSEPSSAHPLKKQLHQVGAYFHKVVTV